MSRGQQPARRQRVTIELDEPLIVVRGWRAHKLAIEAGLRPTYSGVRQGWMADAKRLPDLCAYLEQRRLAYEVVDLNRQAADEDEALLDHGGEALLDRVQQPSLFDEAGR